MDRLKSHRPRDFDWVGHWFALAETRDECTDIIFGQVTGDAPEDVAIVKLPHATYDGITGMIHLLREEGLLRAGVLPRLPRRVRPSWRVRLREASRVALDGQIRARGWSTSNPAWRADGIATQHKFGWRVLSESETREAIKQATSAHVSVNSLLLSALVRAVAPHLDGSSLPTVWVIPVSVHPDIGVGTRPRNQSSYVDISVDNTASPIAIDLEMRRLERNETFWGTELLMSSGRYLGEWSMRAMAATHRATRRRTGAFSNLGHWAADSPPNEARFFCPPAVEFQPLSAGAMTWGDHLSLTVLLHPCLGAAESAVGEVLDSWKEYLLAV